MHRIASVYVAVSLDGFIAREDGGIDWLNAANKNVPVEEDCGFIAFLDSVDVLIMGRKTFEQVLSFEEWAYGKKNVIVLSKNQVDIPKHLAQTVSCSSESPQELTERLTQNGAKRLYIDGGITIQSFLAEGLVLDLIITVIPIVLGKGKSLFGSPHHDIELKHISTKVYNFGFVQSTYEVKNGA